MSLSTVCKYAWAKPFSWTKPHVLTSLHPILTCRVTYWAPLGILQGTLHIHYKNSSSSLYLSVACFIPPMSLKLLTNCYIPACRKVQALTVCIMVSSSDSLSLLDLCEASLLMLHGSNANILCASHVRSMNNGWFWKCFHMSFGNGPNSLHLNPFSSLSSLQNTWEFS